jgi:hypothetical protein
VIHDNDLQLGKPSKKQNQQDYAASQELDERYHTAGHRVSSTGNSSKQQ